MVKHTQTICQLLPTNCLSVFDPFVGLVLKGLKRIYRFKRATMLFSIEPLERPFTSSENWLKINGVIFDEINETFYTIFTKESKKQQDGAIDKTENQE